MIKNESKTVFYLHFYKGDSFYNIYYGNFKTYKVVGVYSNIYSVELILEKCFIQEFLESFRDL